MIKEAQSTKKKEQKKLCEAFFSLRKSKCHGKPFILSYFLCPLGIMIHFWVDIILVIEKGKKRIQC